MATIVDLDRIDFGPLLDAVDRAIARGTDLLNWTGAPGSATSSMLFSTLVDKAFDLWRFLDEIGAFPDSNVAAGDWEPQVQKFENMSKNIRPKTIFVTRRHQDFGDSVFHLWATVTTFVKWFTDNRNDPSKLPIVDFVEACKIYSRDLRAELAKPLPNSADIARDRANTAKLFVGEIPKNADIVDLVVKLDAASGSGKTEIEVAREFFDEEYGNDAKAQSHMAQNPKNAPPRAAQSIAREHLREHMFARAQLFTSSNLH